VDLQRDTTLHGISIGFLSAPESRILLPKQVVFSVSSDGKHWTQLYTDAPTVDLSSSLQRVQRIIFTSTKPIVARYVRIAADRNQSLPTAFPRGATDIWLFADEILIQ
jgi:hypothetical protein